MAMGYQGTYTFIPPPPLPEFYKKTKAPRDPTSTSVSASTSEDEDIQAEAAAQLPNSTDGAYDRQPRRVTISLAPATPLMTVPPPPPVGQAGDVPPLAIYHICRVCLRPRSSRYHREHPIPLDGLPPPPGICRRCRITSIEDTKRVADIVKVGESNDIKIGFITPFVSEEAIIGNDEMRARHAQRYLNNKPAERQSSRNRRSQRGDIVYRHVRVVNEPEDAMPIRETKVKFTTQEDESSSNDWPLPEPPRSRLKATTSMQVQPTENSTSAKVRTARASTQSATGSSRTSTFTRSSDSSSVTEKGSLLNISKIEPGFTGSEIRRIARNEVERYRDDYWRDQCSDSNIRRIAREEVERYREAERKLEAHPEPYAHGRMIPVERRIEQERDIPVPHPWIEVTEDMDEKVFSEASTRSRQNDQPASVQEESSIKRSNDMENPQSTSEPQHEIESLRDRYTMRVKRRSNAGAPERLAPLSESYAPRRSRIGQPDAVSASRRESIRDYNFHSGAVDMGLSRKGRSAASKDVEPSEKSSATPQQAEHSRDEGTRHEIVVRQAELTEEGRNDPPLSQDQVWSRSNRSTRRDDLYAESDVNKVESRLSDRQETTGSEQTQRRATEQQRGEEASPGRQPPAEETSRSRQDAPQTRRGGTRSGRDVRPGKDEGPPYPQTDVEFTQMEWPEETPGAPPSRRTRPRNKSSALNDDVEYLYAERIVQPANRPRGRRPFDDHSPARRIEIEEIVETWRHPTPSSRSSKRERNNDGPAHTRSARERQVNSAAYGFDKHDQPSSHQDIAGARGARGGRAAHRDEAGSRQSQSRSKQDVQDGEDLNHVRFCGEVDVSPTPPDSDASSSEFRAYHSVDGKTSPRSNHKGSTRSAGNPATEPGRQGRAGRSDSKLERDHNKKRLPTLREEVDGDRRGRQGDFQSQGYRRYPKIDTKRSSAREKLDEGNRRGRNEDRKDDQKFTDGAGDKPLARALSESPSREASLSSFRLDARGPYRVEEKVTDSLWVEDGSNGERMVDRYEETFCADRGDAQGSRRRRRG